MLDGVGVDVGWAVGGKVGVGVLVGADVVVQPLANSSSITAKMKIFILTILD